MALVDPFRKLIVDPSLLHSVRGRWNQAFGSTGCRSARDSWEGTKPSRDPPNYMSRAQDVMTNLLALADIRVATLCGSLRRTFPADVAILLAQLRGHISGAQSAGLFDSLFQRGCRRCE
jgi:hypothetical protein